MSIHTPRPFDPNDEGDREEAERKHRLRVARREREAYVCRLERGFALMGGEDEKDE